MFASVIIQVPECCFPPPLPLSSPRFPLSPSQVLRVKVREASIIDRWFVGRFEYTALCCGGCAALGSAVVVSRPR